MGRISAEVIAKCPPGIPILVHGEKITSEHIPFLDNRRFIGVINEEKKLIDKLGIPYYIS